MSVPFQIDGSVAVLTGAGSGIGRATAVALARAGARVVASDIDATRAEETAGLIREASGDAVGCMADVGDEAAMVALRDLALAQYGRVDIVVNNVGVITMGPPESIPLPAWQRVLDLNVLGVVRSNLAFLPLLIEQGRGHIVNTASASGLLAYGFDRLPYVASKHAVVGLSEALALYLAPLGIGVTCACPSGVATNIMEQITFYGKAGSPRAPQHAVVGPEVVANLIVDAIRDGQFLVVTAPEIHDELRERAADIEGYLQRMIAEQTS